jgi:hypothetical protein
MERVLKALGKWRRLSQDLVSIEDAKSKRNAEVESKDQVLASHQVREEPLVAEAEQVSPVG